MTTKKEYADKISLLKRIIFHFVTNTKEDLLDEVKKKVLADVKIIRDEYYAKASEINAEHTPEGLVSYVMKNIDRIKL